MDTQPGQVITPQEKEGQPSSGVSDVVSPVANRPNSIAPPEALPNSAPAAPSHSEPQALVQKSDTPQGEWQSNAQGGDQVSSPSLSGDIEWEAAEFIEHPKDTRWYALLVLAGIIIAAIDYIITRDVVSMAATIMAVVVFGFYAGRKPRMQQYRLSLQGLQVGDKAYAFQNYKHFSVIDEGAVSSIVFLPMKHLEVPLTIYVPTDIGERVVDYLSALLPMEQRRIDAVDGLLRRIRF